MGVGKNYHQILDENEYQYYLEKLTAVPDGFPAWEISQCKDDEIIHQELFFSIEDAEKYSEENNIFFS